MLPSQTSISPFDIASGRANSFFLPAGGSPQPPPPSSISTLADIQVSSITFGTTTGGFPTSGISLYKGNASVSGGTSSTIINVYEGSVGEGNLYLNTLGLMGNSNTVFAPITNSTGAFDMNGDLIFTADATVLTVSAITSPLVNSVAYVPQPVTRFGQGVISGTGITTVNIPRYPTTGFAVGLGGSPSTLVLGRTVSTIVVAGPVGSNFSWFTVATTQ